MKTKTVQLYNKRIPYELRKSHRAKRMRLAVYLDGNFVVTVPKGYSELNAEKYIVQKSKWIASKLEFFSNLPQSKVLASGANSFESNKDKTLKLVLNRLKTFNKVYGHRYNKVSIKNQKTRWGSCTKKRNLNFNFKIIMLSPKLRDYIIVHELCHLKEFNHSRKYWTLVSRAMPDYEKVVSELRLRGLSLL